MASAADYRHVSELRIAPNFSWEVLASAELLCFNWRSVCIDGRQMGDI